MAGTGPGPPVNPFAVFVGRLAGLTGLDPKVIAAWAKIEGAYAANGTGGFNYFNLRAKGDGSWSGVPLAGKSANGFAQFRSPADAATETAWWINRMSNYAGIRASIKQGPAAQVDAIAASPWDAGHYTSGGVQGASLRAAYASVAGKGIDWGHIVKTGIEAVAPGPVGAALDTGKTVVSLFKGPLEMAKIFAGVLTDPTKYLADVGLFVLFLVLGFGLLFLGITRLFGTSPRQLAAPLVMAVAK